MTKEIAIVDNFSPVKISTYILYPLIIHYQVLIHKTLEIFFGKNIKYLICKKTLQIHNKIIIFSDLETLRPNCF